MERISTIPITETLGDRIFNCPVRLMLTQPIGSVEFLTAYRPLKAMELINAATIADMMRYVATCCNEPVSIIKRLSAMDFFRLYFLLMEGLTPSGDEPTKPIESDKGYEAFIAEIDALLNEPDDTELLSDTIPKAMPTG